ncbi:MAG: aspartyl protease family protein [Phycisphaerales bacterium]|nr:aspartyl protease family protein [Phycisphaerales bacterium]
MTLPTIWLLFLLLVPTGDQAENPWKGKVPAANAAAEKQQTVAAYRDALDTAWRADEWQVGLDLASRAAQKFPDNHIIVGRAARAMWRAGEIYAAERLAGAIDPEKADAVGLRTRIGIHLARGENAEALRLGKLLERTEDESAETLLRQVALRFVDQRFDGMGALIRKVEKTIKPENGYPETLAAESIGGLAGFFEKIGNDRINQIAAYGSVPMPVLRMANLPYCEVMINGHGPYRVVVDTGGSVTLSIDTEVAEECGLKSLGEAAIRGVSGLDQSQQALVDELLLGEIRCRRVMTRVFGVRQAVMGLADGVLGTGVFADGRMKLDFANARMEVRASSDAAGEGLAVEARIIEDAKIMVPVKINGEHAVALFDTGADAAAIAPSRMRKLYPDHSGMRVEAPMGGVGQGAAPTIEVTRGVTMELPGRKFEQFSGLGLDVLDKILGPFLGMQGDVLVGMPVFREMRSMTVDFAKSRLWVDWLKE